MNFKSLFAPRPQNDREKAVFALIKDKFGAKPGRFEIYLTALRHKSAARNIHNNPEISNERLEFLGDAVLDAAVAEYLYKTYPRSEEGELTQMKSRIVSRTNLNAIAKSLGIDQLIETDLQATHARDSLGGNALEAVLGALYLDKGYEKTRNATIQVLEKFSNLNSVQRSESDFKSRLYEEAHKQKVELRYSTQPSGEKDGKKVFRSEVFFNHQTLGSGEGLSKKSAEQQASRVALEKLDIRND